MPRSITLRFASAASAAVAATIRLSGRGGGNALPGRVLLALAPTAIAQLSEGRRIALVSGTNGKTTTTALLKAALGGDAVLSNADGSNLDFGVALALSRGSARLCALEVDESYLPSMAFATKPSVIALLNLSRDQLDRTSEVRRLARRWREMIDREDASVIVANADDPLVVFAAEEARRVVWVDGGLGWRWDAVGCPKCEARIEFTSDDWSCSCGFTRPTTTWSLVEGTPMRVVRRGEEIGAVTLGLPGEFNARNALVALATAECILGVPDGLDGDEIRGVIARLAGVGEVAGRYAHLSKGGGSSGVELLLAKNPAGWQEMLHLISPDGSHAPGEGGLVLALNAEIADGRDPSWIWDVPFEVLRGSSRVYATGLRARDLAVRLAYAGIEATLEPDQVAAVESATSEGPTTYLGNYTAFQSLRRQLGSSWKAMSR